MKMKPKVSSETSAIRTQTPGNYPKRNKLHLEHGESLKTIDIKFVFYSSTIFVMSVCLSVRMEQIRSHWGDFHGILHLGIFTKLCREDSSVIKMRQITGILHEDQYTFWSYLALCFSWIGNVWDRLCRENQNTHFMCSNVFTKIGLLEGKQKVTLKSYKPQTTIWNKRVLAAYLSLQTCTQNMWCLLLFHCNSGCTNARSMLCYAYISCLVQY